MKRQIELTETELNTLKLFVGTELTIKNNNLAHANAHATEYEDPLHAPLQRIWEKLNDS